MLGQSTMANQTLPKYTTMSRKDKNVSRRKDKNLSMLIKIAETYKVPSKDKIAETNQVSSKNKIAETYKVASEYKKLNFDHL